MGAPKFLYISLLFISLLVMTHLVECKRRDSESRHRSNGRTSHSSLSRRTSHSSHSHSSPSHSSHSHSLPSHSSHSHSSPSHSSSLHSSPSHSTVHSGSRSRVDSHSTLKPNSHHDSHSSNESGHNTPRRGYITKFHEAEASHSTKHSDDDAKPNRHETTTPKLHKPTDAPTPTYYDSPNPNNNNIHSGSRTSHVGPTTPSILQELGQRIGTRLKSDRAKYATSTTKRPVTTTTPTYEETMPFQVPATGPGFAPPASVPAPSMLAAPPQAMPVYNAQSPAQSSSMFAAPPQAMPVYNAPSSPPVPLAPFAPGTLGNINAPNSPVPGTALNQIPANAVICVPAMVNVADPADPTKRIQVQQTTCYPAPTASAPTAPLPSSSGTPSAPPVMASSPSAASAEQTQQPKIDLRQL